MSEEPSGPRTRGVGREALLAAAQTEFEERGFDQTNTNVIARRAGYAPQTFYRHFADKLEIFLEVYRRWTGVELANIDTTPNAAAAAATLVAHHAATKVFRRSLRALTDTEPRVATARAVSRRLQIQALAARSEIFRGLDPANQVASLLIFERLADALAENDADRLAVSPRGLMSALEGEIDQRVFKGSGGEATP